MKIRLPTGTIIYEEPPQATAREPVPDHGYTNVRVEVPPEDAARIQGQRVTLSAGYEIVPVRCREPKRIRGHWPRIPGRAAHCATATYDDCGEWRDDHFGEVFEFDIPNGEPWDWVPSPLADLSAMLSRGFWAGCERVEAIPAEAQSVYRRDQRVNRKRRAARKRKRGWA